MLRMSGPGIGFVCSKTGVRSQEFYVAGAAYPMLPGGDILFSKGGVLIGLKIKSKRAKLWAVFGGGNGKQPPRPLRGHPSFRIRRGAF
jgi:hypothetical protein